MTPSEAVEAIRSALRPVGTERVPLSACAGRVLASLMRNDRPSPPADVSSMDGFAVRRADLGAGSLPVCATSLPGRAPPELQAGAAVRIVTGAPVPVGADLVVRREDATEESGIDGAERVTLRPPVGKRWGDVAAGQYIRRRGENAPEGFEVAAAGRVITPPLMAALAAVGAAEVEVHRTVRVATLVTGDEVLPVKATPTDHQIRDSNGPALRGLLSMMPGVELAAPAHSGDRLDDVAAAAGGLLGTADVLLLTGGVSMGDFDFVPRALERVGCRVLFHKLAIRPGRPLLVAVGPGGQLVMGLPGNPVSVLTTARRFGVPALRHVGGWGELPTPALVTLPADGPDTTIPLWHFRPVTLTQVPGEAALVSTRGSGDPINTAGSSGFVEVPPGTPGRGAFPYYPWIP